MTNVVDLEARGDVVQAARETEAGYEAYELEAPAVISFAMAREEGGEADGRVDVWAATDLMDDLQEDDKRFGKPAHQRACSPSAT